MAQKFSTRPIIIASLNPLFFLGIYLSRDVSLSGYVHTATCLKPGSPLGGRYDLTSSTAATW